MSDFRTQDEINRAELENPENWQGVGPVTAYVSKLDSRLWVRHSPGWTSPVVLNLGHKRAWLAQTLFTLVGFATLVAVLCVLGVGTLAPVKQIEKSADANRDNLTQTTGVRPAGS